MRKNIIDERIIFSCNSCGKDYEEPYINFQMIDDIQMRIYETKKNGLTSHYTYGRKELDFCSIDCALRFLNESSKMFIREIVSGIKK